MDEVNRKLNELAGLNKKIVEEIGVDTSEKGIYGPNELLDARNLLLDELAEYGNIYVTKENDGSVTVTMGDHEVLRGDECEKLQMLEYSDGTVTLSWNSTAEDVKFTSGTFKASLEMINGRGPNVQSPRDSSEKGVLYYRDRLDTFARTLANVMNNTLPMTLNDQGEPSSIQYRQLLGAMVQDDSGKTSVITQPGHVTAANITVSDEWMDSVDYCLPSPSSATNAQYFTKLNTKLTSDGTTEFIPTASVLPVPSGTMSPTFTTPVWARRATTRDGMRRRRPSPIRCWTSGTICPRSPRTRRPPT